MNDLTLISKRPSTLDSRDVAEMINKQHSNLMRDIRTYIDQMKEANKDDSYLKTPIKPEDYFIEGTYVSTQNKTQPKYDVTKIGCDFIANKLTGVKGTVFTAMYTKKFNEMESRISSPYPVPQTQMEFLAMLAQQWVEKERQDAARDHQLQLQASRLDQIENKIEKRMTDDFFMQLVTPSQLGKMFEPAISGQEVNKRLRAAGLQWRAGGEWIASVEGKKYSSSEPVQLDSGRMIYQLKWQRRVKELI